MNGMGRKSRTRETTLKRRQWTSAGPAASVAKMIKPYRNNSHPEEGIVLKKSNARAVRNAVKSNVRSSIGLAVSSMNPYTPGIRNLQGAGSLLVSPAGTAGALITLEPVP